MITFPTNLNEFIVWLGTNGAAGIIISLLLEKNVKWTNWASPLKSYVVICLFVAIPFLAQAAQWGLTVADPVVLLYVKWLVATTMAGLTAWATSQYSHGSTHVQEVTRASSPKTLASGEVFFGK